MPEQRVTPDPVGIVVKTYPKLSETFILEEVLALERLGLDLTILSLHRPTDDRTNPETAQVQAPVHYAPERFSSLVAEHARVARRHPIRYLRTMTTAVRRGDRASFATAGWLAAQSLRLGLLHLHVHFLSEPASVTELAADLTGLRFSASAHAKDIYLSDPADLKRKMAAARFTVTCTEHNREHLATLAAPGTAVERVHHGIHLGRFRPRPAPPERTMILGVGRLRPKKGFDLLVRACAELAASGHDFECRIVGYGPEQARLKALIEQSDLSDRVRLLGKLTRDEVIEQYAEATMVVQPCRITDDGDRDGIPNVLFEAMAMERPVVTTPISGIPEVIVDGENGCLVLADDPTALASTMAVLLDDPDRRRELGTRARATVARSFTVDRSAEQIACRLHQADVAYVVKGYPRLSELFIATEIYRVERSGLPLRLFVLKAPDEPERHDVVGRTRAKPEYLPSMTSISKRSAWRWLRQNMAAYRGPLFRVATARTGAFGRAAGDALAQAWRARKGRWPRKLYLKEFMQAVAVADGVIADPAIRHLHAHFSHGATTVTWLAATMSGRTFSFTAHAKDIYLADLNPAGLLERKLLAAEFVATCTEANRRHLIEIEPTARVHAIYHGLNEEFAEILRVAGPRPIRPPADPFIVLAVGRLVPKKGLDLLVRACAGLAADGVEIVLRIVGEDGEHRPVLDQLVADHDLGERVAFLGPMDQRQLFEQYREADVFCLPCRILADGDRDGIPNVLVEAMAAGLPVISTPISGIPELIENRHNGLLVSPESEAAVTKALLELYEDAVLRNRLADAALETVRDRFDGWATTRQLVDLLSSTGDRSTP